MKSGRSRISVLVPAFNDEPYLGRALESIATQTFDDFEVIVADDASHDGTVALAQRWVDRDARFRVVRNESNLGMAENWNRALAEARAPLVFKLDADDALEPEALARLEAAMAPSEVRFAACRAVECDASLDPDRPWHGEIAFERAGLDPGRDKVREGWFWFDMSFDDAQLWHSSALLLRREELRARGGWDATWSCAADTDLILHFVASGRPVAHVGYLGALYRRRAGSVSARFEQQGWKRLEAALVSARSLGREGRARASRDPRLRRQWWRHWRNARAMAADGRLFEAMPERQQAKLLAAAASLPAPPASVRLEGKVRDVLYSLRRRLRVAAGS